MKIDLQKEDIDYIYDLLRGEIRRLITIKENAARMRNYISVDSEIKYLEDLKQKFY